MKSGWIKTELKIGHPRWHYFEIKNLETAERYKSLCGQIRFYVMHDTETRHIMEAGNCMTCVKILKKKEHERP